MQNRVFEKQGIKYKKCKNCNVEKEVKDFKPNGYTKIGSIMYRPTCRYCFNIQLHNENILKPAKYYIRIEKRRAYTKKNIKVIKAQRDKYYADNREYMIQKAKARQRFNKLSNEG